MTAISRIRNLFFNWQREVPAATLAFYRILFGVLMLFSTLRFLLNGWVYDFYIAPEFHFSYYGFDWLPYPNATVLYGLFALQVLSCLGIILGFFYRLSSILFFIVFTYIELLDKTTYLNHYYFVSLVALLMIFLPANRHFALDVYFKRAPHQSTIPYRSIAILKFQIAVVYIFAGIAKLESDWLVEAQPLQYWLHTAHHWPFVGDLLKHDLTAYFFSWFGCVYDLFIVFFLLNVRTRNWAYIVVIIFHVTTWLLFPIGVFPWVMIAATTIFLSENFHEKALRFLSFGVNRAPRLPSVTASVEGVVVNSQPQNRWSGVTETTRNKGKIINSSIALFITFQLLFPFRYLLYPGDVFWTEQGFRFSWRVMLMEKSGYAEFYLVDPKNKSELRIENGKHLTRLQEKMMSTQPDMILEYAHYLNDVYADTTLYLGDRAFTFNNPEVHAEIYVTLNGRPSQLYVDKSHNLAAIPNNLSNRWWLEDFNE